MESKTELVELTTEIVSAYVSNNALTAGDLPALINEVHKALLGAVGQGEDSAVPPQKPAVSPRRSVTPEFIICLEDGKKFKSLKRHLRTHYNLTPDEYREKWGLARDYPMVAPNYAAARSKLAKNMGLGQKGRQRKRG